MTKRSFKDSIKGADRLFSANDNDDTHATQDTRAVHAIRDTQDVQATPAVQARLSMRIDAELKDYLADAAWKKHMSITEYICTLIREDMKKSK
jgi:predicted HicB family RNase H-like nuclease